MSYLQLTNNQLNPEGYWSKPLNKLRSPSPRELALFDQNGHDLTNLEKSCQCANRCSYCRSRYVTC